MARYKFYIVLYCIVLSELIEEIRYFLVFLLKNYKSFGLFLLKRETLQFIHVLALRTDSLQRTVSAIICCDADL